MSMTALAAQWRKLWRRCELHAYNPRTIAAYLRKRGFEVGEDCFICPTDLDLEVEPYLLKIGNHVAIAAGVSFMTSDGAAWLLRGQQPELQVYGPIVIEDNCFIGFRSIIYPNVRIGPNAVVAAGSVVVSDVPPNTIVMGAPARPFGSLEKYREKCVQRWAQQRPPGVMIEPGETWWNTRHFHTNREILRKHLLTVFHEQLS